MTLHQVFALSFYGAHLKHIVEDIIFAEKNTLKCIWAFWMMSNFHMLQKIWKLIFAAQQFMKNIFIILFYHSATKN